MAGKSALDGQGVVVQAENHVPLSVQQKRSRGRTGLKCELIAPGSDAGSRGF